MKTYKHLWDDFISEENILSSVNAAIRGKKDRSSTKIASEDIDNYIKHISSYIEHFHSRPHHRKIIKDGKRGKERLIVIPSFDETVVHHMIVNVLNDLFTKGMYKHTYSSIPKRGLHKASEVLKKTIERRPRDVKYVLQLDIKKFFNSIDLQDLKYRLSKYIKDDKILNILFDIIDSEPDNGLPLGFYTSHWLANWLLQPLDHYIVEKLGVGLYIRYMDDMIITSSNKEDLHQIKDCIEEYLGFEYGLKLKQNWQVYRFEHKEKNKIKGRAIDFVGFVFHRDGHIEMRHNLFKRLMNKVKKIEKKGYFDIHDAYQMVSYFGWASWADTYDIYRKMIAPIITKNKLTKYISQYDKKRQDDALKLLYK